MARTGGKAKTRKSVAKRFKVTGSGKILRRRQGRRHLNRRKTSKRLRRLCHPAIVASGDAANIRENLPFQNTR
jgi:large subunit ribosomal protein L35